MRANDEQIQTYIQKQRMTQAKASELVRELMELDKLREDFDSPIVQHLKQHVEAEMIKHGKAALQDVNVSGNYAYQCKCGERIDLHKIYYQTYSRIWLALSDILVKWQKKNEGIIKGSRR